MKAKIFLIALALVVLSSCTAEKIVVDEMIITEKEDFTKFKKESISITTKEPVSVLYNYPDGKRIIKEKILNREPVLNYKFSLDSLLVSDSNFHSVIAIKSLAQINFKGLFDNDVGFVSEDEINKHYNPKFTKTGGAVLGAVIGGTVGMLVGWLVGTISGTKINLFSGTRLDKENVDSGMLICGLAGSILGSVLGINLLSSEQKDLKQILEEIKRERK